MLQIITNRSPSPRLKPLPRAAQTNRSPSPAPLRGFPLPLWRALQTEAPPPRRLRGFPLPLWRGVNGIANNELITVSQTIVGRGPPEGTEKVKSTFRLKANDR